MKSRGIRLNRCLAALLRFGPYDLDVGGAMGDSNKLFYFPCLVFDACAGAGGGGESVWTDTGVDDLAHLSIKVKKHSQSRFLMLCEVQLTSIGRHNIRKALDSAYRKLPKVALLGTMNLRNP
ncbi:hypothetical protein EVAR_31719_1 [Eumeta japonica]|uniref:Uncharacterized protein n=1 Tax=Eumeta variegata TaxID=151549 RepID=A0A4C1YS80_EUMVA|nr:hypothetical protein EVAR_31719_1 [Eumeta japonica]